MNRLQVEQLCSACSLGDPLEEPQAISGGLLHRIWHLDTTQGTFAIKQLNPIIMQKSHMHATYRLSEQIAETMTMHGIPAVAALTCDEDPIQRVGEQIVMVYPWVEGEILSIEAVEPERARKIGTLLGQMHTLNLQFPDLPQQEWKHFLADDWDLLTFQAYEKEIPWATPVRSVMHKLIEWNDLYEQASEHLRSTSVVSHRDLDQKNVIWQNEQTPWIIDWEAAGLINPSMELASVALDWSGLASGVVREDTFTSVLESYIGAGGKIRDAGLDALHGVAGIWLGWLLFNMRRSLGETAIDEEERQLAIHETPLVIARLRTLAHYTDKWASWIDRWRA